MGRPSDDSGAPHLDFGDVEDAVAVGEGAPGPAVAIEVGGDPASVGGVFGEVLATGGSGNAPEEEEDAAANECA